MNFLVLLLLVELKGQAQEIARTFGVDWPHLTAQIISFSIVCALLYRFAYRPVLKMLEDRRQQIALGLANAEKIKAELAQTADHRQEVLTEANAQANRLIEEGHLAAARDYARMLAELKREVGRLVVNTTAAVTGKILTPEDQRRLAEQTAKEVAG